MKPSKWTAKQNKKKRGEDKEKGKNPLVLCHFKAQKLAGNFAFLHALTSEADILHLELKATIKCLTLKLHFRTFWHFIARKEWSEDGQLASKGFFAKIQKYLKFTTLMSQQNIYNCGVVPGGAFWLISVDVSQKHLSLLAIQLQSALVSYLPPLFFQTQWSTQMKKISQDTCLDGILGLMDIQFSSVPNVSSQTSYNYLIQK